MKLVQLLVFLFCFFNVCAQDTSKTFYFKEVSWSITIPENFEIIDAETNNQITDKGKREMEKTTKKSIDISETKTLFSIINSYNYLNATVTPFNPQKDGSYKESNQMVKETLFNTFIQIAPNDKIDSSTTLVTVDGLVFDKFTVTAPLGNSKISICLLSKFYKNYSFGISYTYVNDWAKEVIEKAISNSKFQK